MSDQLTQTIIVKGDVSEIYRLWTEVQNFPAFMKNIKSVHRTGEGTSRWVVRGPLGKEFAWDARVTDMHQDKRIAWNSTGGDVKISGQVTFNDLTPEETEVTVRIHYAPPGGKVGEVIAELFENPEKRLVEDLNQFKKYAEGKTSFHDAKI